MKKDGMNTTWSTHGRDEKCKKKIIVRKPEERRPSR
jgi:hypothetical protein